MMISRPNTKLEWFQIFILILACAVSFYSFYFFLSNKIYLIGSDAFYYISIADSIIQNGELRNISSIPSTPVKTPQNGIVFVHVILSLIGLAAESRVLAIVIINYILYLSACFPLYKVARWSGLTSPLPLMILLSVYLAAWHIYRINLLALNDGIFNSLMLWLVYLIIRFIRELKSFELGFLSKSIVGKMLIISLIVVISVQFRLTVSLVLGSGIIAALIVRNYKASLFLIIISLFLLISFSAIYFFLEVTRLENVGERYFFPMFEAIKIDTVKLQLWKILPRLVAGLSVLANPLPIMMFTIFPLSMMYYGIMGLKEKKFSKVFISCICLTGLWFTMSFQNARVIWYIFPFIYLIVLSIKNFRFFGYAFVLLVLVQSMQQFYIGFSRIPESKYWLYIHENRVSLPKDDSLLLAANGRHLYYLFGKGAFDTTPDNENNIIFPDELKWDLIRKHNSLCVSGDSSYIKKVHYKIENMANSNGYKIQTKPLTPDLPEFKGWALIELKFEPF